MKSRLSKITIILTIFLLILSYIFPILSYSKTENKKYVALGDSIAYGYGLNNRVKQSYASRVKEKYNIKDENFKNLAVSGMTCAEFYKIIKTKQYTEAIKSADLITISIGSNELLGIVTKAISKVTGIPSNDPGFLTKSQEKFLNSGIIEKAKMLAAIYNFFTSEDTKIEIETAINSYKQNWDKSIIYIKEINPNLVIVATEFYNPYYEFSLGSYDLGGFVDENIQKLNEILINRSNSEKDYKIAKIYSAFNRTNPRYTNVNISLKDFNLDPHPNNSGHELICTKILDALSTKETERKNIEKLAFTNIPDQTYNGKEIKPNIIIKDNNTQLVEDKDYTISFVNNIEIGEAKVLIDGIGNYQGSVTKTFNIKEIERRDILNLKIDKLENQIYTGIKIIPDIHIYDGNKQLILNTDYELKYENNINIGQASIFVSGIGNYKGKQNITFNIIERNIKETNIQEIVEQNYTGNEIIPGVIITDGSSKLIENKDYTISYQNNIEVGTATINIKGKGNYTGITSTTFKIVENNEKNNKDINKLDISKIEDKIYTGKLITPEVKIKDEDKVLIKNKDYYLSYSDNIDIGTGTITITGIGDYTGIVNKNFKIIEKEIQNTLISDIVDQTDTDEKKKPEVIISSDGIKLKEDKDYTLIYEDNKEGTGTIQIEGMGNYKGTTTKTFNIVKDNKEISERDNKKDKEVDADKSIADKLLPFAGAKNIILIVIISIFITIISFVLYKKISDII